MAGIGTLCGSAGGGHSKQMYFACMYVLHLIVLVPHCGHAGQEDTESYQSEAIFDDSVLLQKPKHCHVHAAFPG